MSVNLGNFTNGQSRAGWNPATCVPCRHWGNVNDTDGRHKNHAGANTSLPFWNVRPRLSAIDS